MLTPPEKKKGPHVANQTSAHACVDSLVDAHANKKSEPGKARENSG